MFYKIETLLSYHTSHYYNSRVVSHELVLKPLHMSHTRIITRWLVFAPVVVM
jgi:hypothetical protein